MTICSCIVIAGILKALLTYNTYLLWLQVEVDLSNSANHIDSMIVSLPIVTSSGNIKCEGELDELKAKTESLMTRSVEGDTNDSLVTVADVDHSSDNCTITEHIVNNIQVADVR